MGVCDITENLLQEGTVFGEMVWKLSMVVEIPKRFPPRKSGVSFRKTPMGLLRTKKRKALFLQGGWVTLGGE